MEQTIYVAGLKDLGKALKAIDSEAPKGLRFALAGVAEGVSGKIRNKVPVVTGAARSSVRPSATRTSSRVKVGGPKAPYWPWLDFGGEGRRRGRPSFRDYIPGGRYVYPTLEEERPHIMKLLEKALSGVVRDAGLDEG